MNEYELQLDGNLHIPAAENLDVLKRGMLKTLLEYLKLHGVEVERMGVDLFAIEQEDTGYGTPS